MIQLFALCKVELIKKYGIDKILAPFMRDINTLESVSCFNKLIYYILYEQGWINGEKGSRHGKMCGNPPPPQGHTLRGGGVFHPQTFLLQRLQTIARRLSATNENQALISTALQLDVCNVLRNLVMMFCMEAVLPNIASGR